MQKRETSLLIFLFLAAICSMSCGVHETANGKYELVKETTRIDPGTKQKEKTSVIDQDCVQQLEGPLKALGAYYACMAGTDCDIVDSELVCGLTTALGMGSQGSDKHIDILKKWFTNDTLVQTMIGQNCFVGISGSNEFSFYEDLAFNVSRDTVIIKSKVGYYSRGSSSAEKYTDIAIITKNRISFIKRELVY